MESQAEAPRATISGRPIMKVAPSSQQKEDPISALCGFQRVIFGQQISVNPVWLSDKCFFPRWSYVFFGVSVI